MFAYLIRMQLIVIFIFLLGIFTPKQTYGFIWEMPYLTFASFPNGANIDLSADPYGNAFTGYITFDGLPSPSVQATQFLNSAEQYQPPVVLASGDDYTFISIATNATGTALCVWNNNITGEVDYSFFNGTAWGASTTLDTSAFAPNAAMNNLGNGIATWITTDVYVSFFNGGTQTWGTPQLIPGSTGGLAPKIAFNDAGNAIVIWSDFTPDLFASVYNTGLGTWSSPTTIGTNITSYHIDMDASGNAVVVWDDFVAVNVDAVYYNGTWGSPVNISVGTGFNNSLAMNAAGAAIIAWTDGTSGFYSELISGTWTAPALFSLIANDLSVALDSTGNALFTWDDNGSLLQTFSVYKPSGGSVGTPDTVTAPGDSPIHPTVSALSDNGRGFVDGRTDPSEGFGLAGTFTLLGISGSACFDPNGSRVRFLSWSPFKDPNVVAYHLKRNSTLVAVNLTTQPRIFIDPDRNPNITDVYTIIAVDASGNELYKKKIALR